MNNKFIYLVFSRTGTWLSRLISIFSDIRYPHVSLSFDSNFTQMYSFGRTNPDNPFSGGFVVENLHKGVYRKSLNCECLIVRVMVNEGQYDLLQKHIDEFSSEKDKYRYNFLGLCGILVNMPIRRKNYYFCSQFVSEALMKSRVYASDKSPELTRTDDLYMLINKEILYEGYVNDRFSYPVITQVS